MIREEGKTLEYILDIDHIIGLISGSEEIVGRVTGMKNHGARFGITVTILGELYFLIRSTAQMDANVASLTELVADLYVWGFDRGAAEIAGEILTQARSLGRPISEAEAQIAAIARQRQATLLTGVERFADVRDIGMENWLRPQSARR